MKILLVSANSETFPYPVYPLGIDYVAGAVADRHSVFISDINETEDTSALTGRILETAPDLIGISIRNIDNTEARTPKSYIDHYRALVRCIREVSGAPLVLGGSGFTLFPDSLLNELQADYGIIGEGERLAELADALETNSGISGFSGVIANPPAAGRLNYPQPWTGRFERRFNPQSPHVSYYLKKGGMLNIQTQRGCPFKCIYCTYPLIEGRSLRKKSPKTTAGIACELEEAGAKYLFVTDSVFNADPDHSLEVAREFERAGLTIPWGAYLAPVRPRPDYFKILAGAGMTHVEFGTEALCDTVLENYRKPFRTVDIFDAHQAAVEAGLNTAHFFLLGAPAETRATLEETLGNAEALEKTVLFFFAGIRIFPYTKLHEIAAASGQAFGEDDLLTPCFFEPEGIGLAEIDKTLEQRANNRINWVCGAGGGKMAQIVSRLHDRGHAGPLWEHLIR